MYVFDCGVLKIADPMPLFGLKKEEVAATDLADAAYLIGSTLSTPDRARGKSAV